MNFDDAYTGNEEYRKLLRQAFDKAKQLAIETGKTVKVKRPNKTDLEVAAEYRSHAKDRAEYIEEESGDEATDISIYIDKEAIHRKLLREAFDKAKWRAIATRTTVKVARPSESDIEDEYRNLMMERAVAEGEYWDMEELDEAIWEEMRELDKEIMEEIKYYTDMSERDLEEGWPYED